MAVVMLIDKENLDFDDGLQCHVSKKLGAEVIVSFDKHLDKLDIPRKERGEVLGLKEY